MAAGAGVDLDGGRAGGADLLCVDVGLLITLDHRDRTDRCQLGDRATQQRCLAGAGRAHQVERQDPALGQPGPVVGGEVIVLGQQRGLDVDRRRAVGGRVCVRVRVPGLGAPLDAHVRLAAPARRAHRDSPPYVVHPTTCHRYGAL